MTILCLGAVIMRGADFTVGMLVAYQMSSGFHSHVEAGRTVATVPAGDDRRATSGRHHERSVGT
jgi:hypothetical protein